MAQPIDIFQGTMTYNVVNLVKGGTRKVFNGFISMLDVNGNSASYKVVSFRSHVTLQSEALGERGMAGKKVTIHGTFKENTFNGESKWELMAEKIYIEGFEALAAQAEASEVPMPTTPPGTLPPAGMSAPTIPTGPVAPTIQTPNIPMPVAPTLVTSGPSPIVGGYVYNPQ